MYTRLPHSQLIEGCHYAIDQVIPELARRFLISEDDARQRLKFTHDGRWTTDNDSDGWTFQQLKNALSYVVTHNYVLVEGQVHRQRIGIGMGSECSPSVSNLYLHSKERKYVERKIAELGEAEVLRRYYGFRYHCRFIDDFYAPIHESEFPTSSDYDGLELCTTGTGNDVVFLGIKAEISTEGRVNFFARDKQQGFDCRIVRFPSFDSNMPRHIMTGTIVGMLTRTLQLSVLVI